MRTNIVIDEKLLHKAMKATGLRPNGPWLRLACRR